MWLHLLRRSGRSAGLEVGLPVVAGAVITLVLLLLVGLQQGLDHRAERTEWRTPDDADGQAVAIQGGYTDYLDDRPLQVIELAALPDSAENPLVVPGSDGFPEPGEVWVSPALAELIAERPADEAGGRFPGPPTGELASASLEHPDELVAVVGHEPDESVMTQERPKHQWNAVSSMTPTEIDSWSTTPDLYQTTYRDMAVLVAFLVGLPLVGLGGLASRLMASRRQRRLATMRLLGARTSQVARMTLAEFGTLTALGAVIGAAAHGLLLPAFEHVTIKGGPWFGSDIRLSLITVVLVAIGSMALLTLSALTGLLPAIRDPLHAYQRSRTDQTKLWGVAFLLVAIVIFWLRSSNYFVSLAFTVVVLLGWGLVSMGPLIVKLLGAVLARSARDPAGFLAGRRLSSHPKAAWRTVGGIAMAAFLAGFVAMSVPVALNMEGERTTTADRVGVVLPADQAPDAVDAVAARVSDDVDVSAEDPPSWLDEEDWATVQVVTDGSEAAKDRVRTAMAANGYAGPQMRMAEDQPNAWLLRDGIAIGLLVMPIAALVALASMIIGAIARVFDQRETLTSLRLAGTPLSVLVSAQRREMALPTLITGGIGVVGGLAAGSALGVASPFNLVTGALFAGIILVAAVGIWVADRSTRPILAKVTGDLSERE